MKKFIILFLIFYIFSCQQPNESASDKSGNKDNNSSSSSTDDNYITKTNDWDTITFSEYIIENNVWGKGSITDYSQSIFYNQDTPNNFGWEWNWPDSGTNVKSYPEIIYGKKPWNENTTTSKLPTVVSNAYLTIDITSTTTATETYNTAFDIWLTESQTADETEIKAELMIWLNYSNMTPATDGSINGEDVTIDGQNYKLYVYNNFGDPSGGGLSWTYIAFTKQDQTDTASLKLESFLTELLNRSLIQSLWYVATIELGNEIVSGNGKTDITEYNIQ